MKGFDDPQSNQISVSKLPPSDSWLGHIEVLETELAELRQVCADLRVECSQLRAAKETKESSVMEKESLEVFFQFESCFILLFFFSKSTICLFEMQIIAPFSFQS